MTPEEQFWADFRRRLCEYGFRSSAVEVIIDRAHQSLEENTCTIYAP